MLRTHIRLCWPITIVCSASTWYMKYCSFLTLLSVAIVACIECIALMIIMMTVASPIHHHHLMARMHFCERIGQSTFAHYCSLNRSFFLPMLYVVGFMPKNIIFETSKLGRFGWRIYRIDATVKKKKKNQNGVVKSIYSSFEQILPETSASNARMHRAQFHARKVSTK